MWYICPFCLLSLFLVLFACGSQGDPQNLVLNGDFEKQVFRFSAFPQQDVIHDGEMAFIPFFQVVSGGVQVLDATEYLPNPDVGGGFMIHMNYYYGRGVLWSVPLVTPRKGGLYNLSFDMADNPDGGPLYKTLRVRILVNNEVADPVIEPFNVSSPQSTRSTISWVRLGCTFVGTGESTVIQFESLVPGSFGALIDNVNVTLLSLVENGSFEDTSETLYLTNGSFFNVIAAPSSVITGWTVTSGHVKRATNWRWQSSTDESTWMLDLNANSTGGLIASDPFPTRKGYTHTVLYDATANPEDTPAVMGTLFVAVTSSPKGTMLASASTVVNALSYTQSSLGWQTYMLSFKAKEDKAVLQFASKIPGSDGPFLDNIFVFQVVPTGDYKSVGLTYDKGTTAKEIPIWIIILTSTLSIALSFQ